jgi:hypothetical protein
MNECGLVFLLCTPHKKIGRRLVAFFSFQSILLSLQWVLVFVIADGMPGRVLCYIKLGSKSKWAIGSWSQGGLTQTL